jgi:hypothetical protein
MLSHTERIDEFHLKVSHTEKGMYEEFLKIEEAVLVLRSSNILLRRKVTPACQHCGSARCPIRIVLTQNRPE